MNALKSGTLIGIARRAAPRVPMETLTASAIDRQNGVQGDCRGKPSKRQVTLLSREAWESACADVDADLPWTTRRANLLLEGFTFTAHDVGAHIHIGEVILEITRETDPCHRMDAQHAGLTQALTPDWRGGVCSRVRQDGIIRIGDEVIVRR